MTRLSKTLAMSAVLAADTAMATLGLSGPAMADPSPECNDGGVGGSTECGSDSSTGGAALATAVGDNAAATGNAATAVGESSLADQFATVAVGASSNASAETATALGAFAVASAENSVALGAISEADRPNSVSLGFAGFERQITNLAAGTEDTDGVNVAQLNAARAALQSQVDGVQTQVDGLQGQLNGVQSQLSTVFDDIERMNEGVALSLAMESPALPDGADFALSGGVGYFNESAAGAAAFTARIAHRASFSAGVGLGFDTNEVGARTGFQVAW